MLEPEVDGVLDLDQLASVRDRCLGAQQEKAGETGRDEPECHPGHALGRGALVGDPQNHRDRPYRPDPLLS